jgi:DnaK suppressor protein
MMNQKELQKYKSRLLEQSDAVSKEIEDHSERKAVANSEFEASIVNSDDQLLQKIRLALQRIEDGTYGQCAECGGKISAPRLNAKPSVSLCTGCQEKKEQAG